MPHVRMVTPNVLGVKTNLRENPSMHRISGAKYKAKPEEWHAPFTLFNCQALRRVYGSLLEVEEEVFMAAKQAQERIRRAKHLKSLEGAGEYWWQKIGTQFLEEFKTVILADDQGLGKTKEVIDTFSEDGAHLVVVTNSMKYEWEKEVRLWNPKLEVRIFEAKKKQDLSRGVTIVNWESLRSNSKLVGFGSMSLTAKQKEPKIFNQHWDTLVADEAHHAKEPKSQQTRALWAVGITADKRFALTGTPVANGPVDYWALLHFIDPQAWPSKSHFIDRYCILEWNPFTAVDVTGLNPATEEELRELSEPYFLRRTKANVGIDLPPKIFRDIELPLTKKQEKAYKEMKKEMLTKLESGILLATRPLTQMQRLIQIAQGMPVLDEDGEVVELEAPSNKLDKLIDILENTNEQLIVFASSRKLIDLVSAKLEKYEHGVIAGGQKPKERSMLVSKFQNGDLRFLLISTQAGSEGLTLTNASTMVFLEKPWSQIQWLQAPDRIHRIGQTADKVEIISLISKGTVEELITPALARKFNSLQEICQDEEFWREVLTQD